jgi:hypothetical protein
LCDFTWIWWALITRGGLRNFIHLRRRAVILKWRLTMVKMRNETQSNKLLTARWDVPFFALRSIRDHVSVPDSHAGGVRRYTVTTPNTGVGDEQHHPGRVQLPDPICRPHAHASARTSRRGGWRDECTLKECCLLHWGLLQGVQWFVSSPQDCAINENC